MTGLNNITPRMVTTAYQELEYIILFQDVPNDEKMKALRYANEKFRRGLIKDGIAWIPSKNLMCRFQDYNIDDKLIEYKDPIPFEDFLSKSLFALRQIFYYDTLTMSIQRITDGSPEAAIIGKETIYKGYFGYILFGLMLEIYNSIPWLTSPYSPEAYMCDSFLYNTWWNNVVNSEHIIIRYVTKDDQETVKEEHVWIKPIIAVDKKRNVRLSDCMLVDYNYYL